MAGAERVEGTLFGNGERTGNVDIVTMALNLFTQGVDPELDLRDVNAIKEIVEHCNQLPVHQRHPYVGELVYTAFSGSHQDAIKKGFEAQAMRNDPLFQVPYLPIDPKDVGRDYEAVIRINSQSGKGGMAYILKADYGLDLPRSLQIEFSRIAQERMDADGKELTSPELWALFRRSYLLDDAPMTLVRQQTVPTSPDNRELVATLRKADGTTFTIEGEGNGPVDAFVDALKKAFGVEFSFIDYHEHAVGRGANATAASYVEINDAERPGAARRGDGPQHRDGLAQGDAERRAQADAARGQGLGGRLPPKALSRPLPAPAKQEGASHASSPVSRSWSGRGRHRRGERHRPRRGGKIRRPRHEGGHGRRQRAALERAEDRVSRLAAHPGDVRLCVVDVSDVADVERLKDLTYAEFGEVALLMNNAGIEGGAGVLGDLEKWRRVIDVNLWGVIHGVNVFAPEMIRQSAPSAIVNTGSKQGITCPPGDTAYNVSKAGVKVVTEALAHELRNIEGCQASAHLLIPGFTFTGLTRAAEKPAGAWTAEQVIDFMIDSMSAGDFYILCPDNEVTRADGRAAHPVGGGRHRREPSAAVAVASRLQGRLRRIREG